MAALLGVALAMVAIYWAIVAFDQQVDDLAGIALMLGVTACTGVALGKRWGRSPRANSRARRRSSSSPACSRRDIRA